MSDNFETWWQQKAVFINQGMFETKAEFVKRLCQMAWEIATNDEREACTDLIADLVLHRVPASEYADKIRERRFGYEIKKI